VDEQLLYYIWQHQLFSKTRLVTTDGEKLVVFNPGFSNENSGPDFQEARIKLDQLEWVGNIELHVKASDWQNHNHQHDPAYQHIILHVVWINDKSLMLQDGTYVPTLELKNRVDHALLENYRKFIQRPEEIVCQNSLETLDQFTILMQLEKMLIERLQEKANHCLQIFEKTNSDWEETAYIMLCRAFGMKVNQEPFEILAKNLPYKIIQKNKNKPKSVMALLFGIAGFLEEDSKDDYQNDLKNEWIYLSHKYNLKTALSRYHWKFSKLRPPNFPTVRLAQLSGFFIQDTGVMVWLSSSSSRGSFILSDQLDSYWVNHYDFGKKLNKRINNVGSSLFDHVQINVAAPLIFARAQHEGDQELKNMAVNIFTTVKPENNKITRLYATLGFPLQNAFDSQAVIQLHRNYCLKKRCLSCSIGSKILSHRL